MCGIDILFQFGLLDLVRNEFGSIWSEKCGSVPILVIHY